MLIIHQLDRSRLEQYLTDQATMPDRIRLRNLPPQCDRIAETLMFFGAVYS